MARLPFDCFVWLDADTLFVRDPGNVLNLLGKSPIHVPLQVEARRLHRDLLVNGLTVKEYIDLVKSAGITTSIYICESSFWIVRREAINALCELCLAFLKKCSEIGRRIDFSAALGYAMHALCDAPEAHTQAQHHSTWATDEAGYFKERTPAGQSWPFEDRFSGQLSLINPAIIHLHSTARNEAAQGEASKDKELGTNEEIFTEIYRSKVWGDPDSHSGTGSNLVQTQVLTKELSNLFRKLNISPLLDIPCGDFFWMRAVDLGGVSYLGADIVSELIAKNKQFERENVRFVRLDLTQDTLPARDLILVRDCLVHFSYTDIFRALRNICRSGAKHLLTTTFTRRYRNIDITTGEWRTLNLEIAPFHFPKPITLINENCTEGGGQFSDEGLGLWKATDIRELLEKMPEPEAFPHETL